MGRKPKNTVIKFEHAPYFRAIEFADLGERTKKRYKAVLAKFLAQGYDPTDANAIREFAQGLCSSNRAFFAGALKHIREEIEFQLKSKVVPENVLKTQAALWRLEAMQKAIKHEYSNGTSAQKWLTREEVEKLMETCPWDDGDAIDKRDWLVLALMVGAGLRRQEVCDLEWSHIVEVPINGDLRMILNVKGKGEDIRAIPVHPLLAQRLNEWKRKLRGFSLPRVVMTIRRSSRLFRSRKYRRDEIIFKFAQTISVSSVYNIVIKRSEQAGIPNVRPHSLRRTFCQTGYDLGWKMKHLSLLMGHKSTKTTETYVLADLDLKDTISDHVPLK
jgi:integrase